jgi:hypothetical protein
MGQKRQSDTNAGDGNVCGVFRWLGSCLDLLLHLAERAAVEGEVAWTGEIGGDGEGGAVVYGISARIADAGQPVVERSGGVLGGPRWRASGARR